MINYLTIFNIMNINLKNLQFANRIIIILLIAAYLFVRNQNPDMVSSHPLIWVLGGLFLIVTILQMILQGKEDKKNGTSNLRSRLVRIGILFIVFLIAFFISIYFFRQ